MTAILINPFDKTVTALAMLDGLAAIYAALSSGPVQVGTFQIIELDKIQHVRNTLYIDDNGLLHTPPVDRFFEIGDYPQPLAGCGLILGTNAVGDSTSTTYDIQTVRPMIRFRDDIRHVGFEHSSGRVDHPILGPDTAVFAERAVFKPK